MHFNHPKCNLDLEVPLIGLPDSLSNKEKFYFSDQNDTTLMINTWIGVYGEIFNKCGGINLFSLTESWAEIFNTVNSIYDTQLEILQPKEMYLPQTIYSFFNVEKVDEWLKKHVGRKKVLISNGVPMSSQSFNDDMADQIREVAMEYSDVDFICTKVFQSGLPNIFFTDYIIQDKGEYEVPVFWVEGGSTVCDLNEISYLSTQCDLIVGKNSGPFVYCETFQNYNDPSKKFLTFNNSTVETMSYMAEKKCQYTIVTDHSKENVYAALRDSVSSL
jgi:hypothetical protein